MQERVFGRVGRFVFGGTVAVATLLACGDKSAVFNVQYAPGYSAGPLRASILGVYRDGRLDVDAVHALGQDFPQAFHADACDTAFGPDLRGAKPALYTALDDATRTDGITEPLLAALAPAAEGDVVLFVTMAGKVRVAPDGGGGGVSVSTPIGGSGRGGGRRGRGGARPMPQREEDTDALDLSATVYSIREKRFVALVAMTYTGSSETEALDAFRRKLAATFPNATCAGWRAEGWPTDDAIRGLPAAP